MGTKKLTKKLTDLILCIGITSLFILLFPRNLPVAKAASRAGIAAARPEAGYACQSFSATDLPIAIVDNATVASTITINTNFAVEDVNIRGLLINHTWVSDLTVYLTSPGGTEIKLFANTGGSGDHFIDTELDDSAEDDIQVEGTPFNGVYHPLQPLSRFIGEAAKGNWKLAVKDNNTNDDGTLVQWTIEFCLASDLPTNTPSPVIETPIPTAAATHTPIPPTLTSTPIIATNTPLPTMTNTQTAVPTIFNTNTPTSTATPTASSTASPTPTATATVTTIFSNTRKIYLPIVSR